MKQQLQQSVSAFWEDLGAAGLRVWGITKAIGSIVLMNELNEIVKDNTRPHISRDEFVERLTTVRRRHGLSAPNSTEVHEAINEHNKPNSLLWEYYDWLRYHTGYGLDARWRVSHEYGEHDDL